MPTDESLVTSGLLEIENPPRVLDFLFYRYLYSVTIYNAVIFWEIILGIIKYSCYCAFEHKTKEAIQC